jgi:putative Mg2+ transporter-C (MgtC) family protein
MISPYEIIFKLLLGALLGGIIGFERQTHGRPAGFRTQLLVCVACVLIMIISESYFVQSAVRPE